MGSSNIPIESEGISQTKNAKIIADGGTVLLTTADALKVVDNVINMEGFIQANTVKSNKGTIILSAARSPTINHKKGVIQVSGIMQAMGLKANQKGGNITISGEHIGIFENAKINASGDIEGGKINLGGEKQGRGLLPHADAIFIAPEVDIRVDALNVGNGGELIVWSDHSTRCYGSLSATAGRQSGDGGFIETSGGSLDLTGSVINAQAWNGKSGTWLIDPYNLTLGPGLSASVSSVFVGGVLTYSPTASGANLGVFDINNNLQFFTNVVATTQNLVGLEPGNITLTTALIINILTSSSLTLQPDGSININATINAANAPINLSFNAPAGNTGLNAPISLFPGSTTSITTQSLTGAGPITTTTLTLNAQSANFSGSVNGLSDGSNIGGMAASIAAYGPNYAGSSRYFFNGNEFWTTPAPVPPTPTPNPTPTPTVIGVIIPANTVIPASNLSITPTTPTAGKDKLKLEEDTSSTKSPTTDTKTTTISTTSTTTSKTTTTTSTITPDTSILPRINPIDTTFSLPAVTALPSPVPPPALGAIPQAFDVPIGGILEPVTNFTTEIPITNIEDKAGIPNLSVERTVFDKTVVKPAVVVPISNSVGPTGVNGTDMAVGTAGIGGGIQEPVVHKTAPTIFKKAEEVIGASSDEESIPNVPCPEGPNCIPGVDSFKTYHPALH